MEKEPLWYRVLQNSSTTKEKKEIDGDQTHVLFARPDQLTSRRIAHRNVSLYANI